MKNQRFKSILLNMRETFKAELLFDLMKYKSKSFESLDILIPNKEYYCYEKNLSRFDKFENAVSVIEYSLEHDILSFRHYSIITLYAAV